MALYQLLRIGVLNTSTAQIVRPLSGAAWDAYIAWRKAGNQPDPYVEPTPEPETLAHAKARRIAEFKSTGVERIQTRFPALANLDTVQLLREIMLSVVPAARSLTADMQWVVDTYQAGTDAVDAVKAATSVTQVNSVTAAWPPL